jgi:hypothetical protein
MFSQFLLFMWVLQSLVAALVELCAVDPGSCGKMVLILVPFSLSRIMMSGLLLGMVLSVCTC